MSLFLDFDLFLRDYQKHFKLSPQASFLGYRFAGLIGNKRDCWISQDELAQQFGCCIRTLRYWLKELSEGVIINEVHYPILIIEDDAVNKTKNRYRFADWLLNYCQTRYLPGQNKILFSDDPFCSEQGVDNLSVENQKLQDVAGVCENHLQDVAGTTCKTLHVDKLCKTDTSPHPSILEEDEISPKVTIKETKRLKLQSILSFEEFWKVYPNKAKKKDALRIWQKNKLDHISTEIIQDVLTRKEKHRPWLEGFIPMPTTYLNGERWNDELKEEKHHANKSNQSSLERGWDIIRQWE